MKYTTVKISEIRQHPTMRLDAKYWVKRKNKKTNYNVTSSKRQATSNIDKGSRIM